MLDVIVHFGLTSSIFDMIYQGQVASIKAEDFSEIVTQPRQWKDKEVWKRLGRKRRKWNGETFFAGGENFLLEVVSCFTCCLSLELELLLAKSSELCNHLLVAPLTSTCTAHSGKFP